ncbi:16S rRNA (guanine966-N2)-methyltransferase [Entomoplasma ellychniae]|uniref:16S rRNA (Guanine966-N2)-methyltransferase n=2 Tax=Entomoplasmataceae TaxID=33925 RepID=A0A2S5RGP9_9MOLU|nr:MULTISPECIES: 16S rRNA (guanine(966)-N(2))-methyltransferase RsmD [Entomoplasmataceae]PPE04988.1 16S rRNA (guanine966-N2)-methyltransferase [Entomoplasma ellychniae]PPE06480.1 16S rRNA (guanine966-N2)-methyltransferase [Mesoplasma corruscae]
MHVISGKYKGMKLQSLNGMNTRPTLTRIKEDAFNILSNYFLFENKKSLDIFGGSGALTIEGLSRGIQEAWINDISKEAIEVIKINLNKTNNEKYNITNYDYIFLLQILQSNKQSFDLVYLDPPFAKVESYNQVIDSLLKNKILNKWGVIILESEVVLEIELLKEFVLIKHKGYNKKNLYILRLEK